MLVHRVERPPHNNSPSRPAQRLQRPDGLCVPRGPAGAPRVRVLPVLRRSRPSRRRRQGGKHRRPARGGGLRRPLLRKAVLRAAQRLPDALVGGDLGCGVPGINPIHSPHLPGKESSIFKKLIYLSLGVAF